MEQIHVTDYVDAGYERPELRKTTVEWQKECFGAMLPRILSGLGTSEEESERKVAEIMLEVDELAGKGVLFPMPLVTLVAQRKL
jgi:hypothetical protein